MTNHGFARELETLLDKALDVDMLERTGDTILIELDDGSELRITVTENN